MPLHLALYGNVAMWRGLCPHCKSLSLIVDEHWACCDNAAELPTLAASVDSSGFADQIRYKRMIEAEQKKRGISKTAKKQILEEQNNRCLYCERRFGTLVQPLSGGKTRMIRLVAHWDHIVPYCYTQNNKQVNFAAACQQCNSLKGAIVFQSIEDARVYITNEIKRRCPEAL